jgi:hypothetical protein
VIELSLAFFVWWVNQDIAKKKEKSDLKKEVDDAVASKDVARINSLIQRINRV